MTKFLYCFYSKTLFLGRTDSAHEAKNISLAEIMIHMNINILEMRNPIKYFYQTNQLFNDIVRKQLISDKSQNFSEFLITLVLFFFFFDTLILQPYILILGNEYHDFHPTWEVKTISPPYIVLAKWFHFISFLIIKMFSRIS